MTRDLRQALRMLLLPMRRGREGACGRALAAFFDEHEIANRDMTRWVRLELDRWRDSGAPTEELREAVRTVLRAAEKNEDSIVAKEYFELHRRLIDAHQMTHSEAVAFLSHAFLIVDLATTEGLSAAQIAKLANGRDQRVEFSRQSVALVLQKLGCLPELEMKKVRRLFTRESRAELPTFADADLATAADMVDDAAKQLGYIGGLRDALAVLQPTEGEPAHVPYLQILHYQCVIAEFFDHAVTDLYEFNPRGAIANWLAEQYPNAGAGNPFLNNAKSVERIDASWVRSKKNAERPGARALLNVLTGLEAMGFAPRRELARWIRLWLCRSIRLGAPYAVNLPDHFSRPEIGRILSAVSAANTETFGIVEQRVLDCVAVALHPVGDGWRARGLLDSVNATNLSRRKLGDCDFQHSSDRRIEAYESHAGVLTATYVLDHFRTLAKAIQLREQELAGIADLPEWRVKITFVAHEFEEGLPLELAVNGLRIRARTKTFKEFVEGSDPKVLVEIFRELFISPLSQRRTPPAVRQRVLTMVAAK